MFTLGRLAQLVERHIDVVDVRGSTPLSPTKIQKAESFDSAFCILVGDKKANCLAFVRSRIGVAVSIMTNRVMNRNCDRLNY